MDENPQVEPAIIDSPDTTLADVEALKIKLAKAEEAKRQITARAKAAESAKTELEAKLTQVSSNKGSLDVEDYINISESFNGLDQREKEYLAQQHKLQGKSIKDIRASEDFMFWQSAYQQKVEKDKLTLKPSGTQSVDDRPLTLEEALKSAKNSDEKSEILKNAFGYNFSGRPRSR